MINGGASRCKWLYAVALGSLLLLALALRLWDLGAASLWYDELFVVMLAREPLAVVLDVVIRREAHIGLFNVVMYLSISLIGPSLSENLARVPSAIFGAAGSPQSQHWQRDSLAVRWGSLRRSWLQSIHITLPCHSNTFFFPATYWSRCVLSRLGASRVRR